MSNIPQPERKDNLSELISRLDDLLLGASRLPRQTRKDFYEAAKQSLADFKPLIYKQKALWYRCEAVRPRPKLAVWWEVYQNEKPRRTYFEYWLHWVDRGEHRSRYICQHPEHGKVSRKSQERIESLKAMVAGKAEPNEILRACGKKAAEEIA